MANTPEWMAVEARERRWIAGDVLVMSMSVLVATSGARPCSPDSGSMLAKPLLTTPEVALRGLAKTVTGTTKEVSWIHGG
jgi:hypothetical protein